MRFLVTSIITFLQGSQSLTSSFNCPSFILTASFTPPIHLVQSLPLLQVPSIFPSIILFSMEVSFLSTCPTQQSLKFMVMALPLQIFLTTHFKYQGNTFLDIKIRPFLDRKEQLHVLFQSYLPVDRFYCRFERSSNSNFFIIGAVTPPLYATCHLYNIFYEDGYF